MAYVSLAEVKQVMDIGTDVNDTLITRLIPWATQTLDNLTGRSFLNLGEFSKTLAGGGDSLLSIPDLISLSMVEVRSSPSEDFETVENKYVLLEPSDKPSDRPYTGAYLIPGSSWRVWPNALQTVRLTGVWGWSAIPAPIKEAAAYLIANWIRMGRLGFTSTLTNEGMGQRRVSYNLPKLVKDTAEFYRRREIVAI